MPVQRPGIDQINLWDQQTFRERLGFVFERSPWIAAEAWRSRPFADLDDLHAALCRVMYAATTEQKLALIRAHPDLAGKAAIAGELTPESSREQSSAGLDRLTPAEFARFTELNEAYRQQFGFPFIICVREQTRDSILASFVDRLGNTPEQEIETALGEIARIAYLRLRDVVASDQR